MASTANLENKQSPNKACRKIKYYPKKNESISVNVNPNTASAI